MMLALGIAIIVVSLVQTWFLLAMWWCLRRMSRKNLDLSSFIAGGEEEGTSQSFDDNYYSVGYLRGDYD